MSPPLGATTSPGQQAADNAARQNYAGGNYRFSGGSLGIGYLNRGGFFPLADWQAADIAKTKAAKEAAAKKKAGGANGPQGPEGASGEAGPTAQQQFAIGLMSRTGASGPIHVGLCGGDQHEIGKDADGFKINSAHIDTDAYFRYGESKDAMFDGPLKFEYGKYKDPGALPYRGRVHLKWDDTEQHNFLGEQKQGKWRWECEFTYETGGGKPPPAPPTTPPRQPPPTTPPTTPPTAPPTTTPSDPPQKPNAPGTPTTPSEPGTSVTPNTGGGSDPTPPTPPAAPSGPGFSRPWDGGGWPFPRGGPWARGKKSPDPKLEQSGAQNSRPSQKTDGSKVENRTNLQTSHPALNFKAASTNRVSANVKESTDPDVARAFHATSPTVVRMDAYAGQFSTGRFRFNQAPGKSVYEGGTANGGVAFVPPEYTIEDAATSFSRPTVTPSVSYVLTVPSVFFGAGIPDLEQGGMKTGYRWGASADGTLTFSAMDSAGAATPAVTLDPTGGTTVNRKFSLAGVVSPAQIASNQNDYNPTGLSGAAILRINSDAARSVTGLSGGTDDRMLVVTNTGAFPITLPNQSGSSTAANRFLFGSDLVLGPEESVWLTYDNASARWRSVGRSSNVEPRLLTTAEPSNTQRVLVPDLSPSTPFLLVATDCYFVYVGRAAIAFTPKFVEFLVTSGGVGIQTAEVGLFSSPGPPDKTSKTTLTKIEATGTVDDLTTTGVKRNTSAFSTSVPAGTHLWAAIRTNLTVSQPTLLGIANDMDQGQIQLDNAAAALTTGATKNGTIIGSALAVAANCPYLTVTLD